MEKMYLFMLDAQWNPNIWSAGYKDLKCEDNLFQYKTVPHREWNQVLVLAYAELQNLFGITLQISHLTYK